MNKLKKWLVIMSISVMCLTLISCFGKSGNDSNGGEPGIISGSITDINAMNFDFPYVDASNSPTKYFYQNKLYNIVNNMWGINENNVRKEDYRQRIFNNGWQWVVTKCDKTKIAGYPEIFTGTKPYGNNNKVIDGWPKKYSDITKFTCKYDVERRINSSCDTSFEFYTLDSSGSSEKSISTEVMLWVDHQGTTVPDASGGFLPMQPIPIFSGVALDGKIYDIFQNHIDHDPDIPGGWQIITFRRRPGSTGRITETIDFMPFLKYLYEKGLLVETGSGKNPVGKTDDYISGLEFGNEPQQGQGITKINNFEVNITTLKKGSKL